MKPISIPYPSVRMAVPIAPLLLLAACNELGFTDTSYHPVIDPANFREGVDHPYFPLVPGTSFRFREVSEGRTYEDVITVTNDTKVVMGVKCVVVRDTVSEQGTVKEDTFDWYAQDKQGTVWYMGEDTKEYLSGGKFSTEGSWEAGINGAHPGIIMPANPQPGAPYRQEYGPGVAEDMGQIVALNESVTVPCGSFTGCVKTKDWSMLESGNEWKWYAKGIGVVRAEATGGDTEELLSVTRP